MPRDAKGRFLPGPDAARHALTKEERRKGYLATKNHPDPVVAAWIWRRMRSRYRKAGAWYPNRKPRTGAA